MGKLKNIKAINEMLRGQHRSQTKATTGFENKKTEQKLEETRLIWRNMIITVLEKAEKQKELKTKINIPQTADFLYTLIIGIALMSKTKIDSNQLLNTLNDFRDKYNFSVSKFLVRIFPLI